MTTEALIIILALVLLLGCGGFFYRRRGHLLVEKNSIAKSEPHHATVADFPVMEVEAALTPKAERKSANKLPRAEQMNRFEKYLEAHDSGNQPA